MTDEYRRARRQPTPDNIDVIDTMTDRVVGRLGNLSETGMLVISGSSLVDDALYQLRFHLPSSTGNGDETIEVGAHLLWQNLASAPGQAWSGFRFITLTDASQASLRAWLGPVH
jgi:hypothetical protein